MRKASAYMILEQATGPFGGPSIGFGPIIDGNLVLDVPDRILANAHNGRHRPGRVKRVVAGGMRNDGIGNPPTSNRDDFVKMFARTPSNSTVKIIEQLYANDTYLSPPSNELPAQTTFDEFYGDIIYECHAYFTAEFWSKDGLEAYRYDQSILPATHGDDLNYYFFDKVIAVSDPNVIQTIATKFQDYLRRFILGQDMEGWPEYSSKGRTSPSWMNITANGFEAIVGKVEIAKAHRCESIVKLLGRAADGW